MTEGRNHIPVGKAAEGCFVTIHQLEGNVLRNLRPAMFQMFMGKDILISMISKYPRYQYIHDIQISMISKYP